MDKNTLTAIGVVAVAVMVIAAGALYLSGGGTETAANQPAGGNSVAQTPAEQAIVYTDSGFSPQELIIKKGTKVTYRNQSSKMMWPASAMHPTHEVYPGSSIRKCGTADETEIFDACRAYEFGMSWSFAFNEVGTWAYHDHITPTFFGRVIVEE